MQSLRSLAAAHRAVLLIDSSSTRIQIGLWHRAPAAVASLSENQDRRDGEPPLPDAIWHASDQEAGIAIFAGVEAVLTRAHLSVADLDALVFCEGPGSILGIRTAAMALRIWSATGPHRLPTFAYRSLELVAHDLRCRGVPEPFAVLADARRDSWHWVAAREGGAFGPLLRIAASAAAGFDGRLYTPAGFRSWGKPPGDIFTIPYDLPDLWSHQCDAALLRPAPHPDAFVHEEPAYLTWAPQIHRAGISASRPQTES
jgi:tRNA threonylcarbamoyladenosine biosynthesis protein TsaB